jgi:hypothetical protein
MSQLPSIGIVRAGDLAFIAPGVVARPGVNYLALSQIRDTNVHSYRNDSGFKLQKVGIATPPYRKIGIWMWNNEDQQASVDIITNISKNGTYPDATVVSGITLAPGQAYWQVLDAAYEFIGLQVSYSTAPTTGFFMALLFGYH